MKYAHLKTKHHRGVVTLAYHLSENRAVVGMAMSPPTLQWDRKKLNAIAKARSLDSPIILEYEGLNAEVEEKHVVFAMTILALEEPAWQPWSTSPLRPKRFTHQWRMSVLGTDSSLVHAHIDVKVREMADPKATGKVIGITSPYSDRKFDRNVRISHWMLRIPEWVRTLFLER